MAAIGVVPFFLISTTVFGALLLAGRRLAEWWRMFRMVAKLPGPPALPILGNLLDIGHNPETVQGNILKLTSRYPKLTRFWIAHVPVVVLQDPDDIQHILGSYKHIGKPAVFYNALEPLMGSGLTFLKGSTWRHHRKIITNTFHMDILRSFVPVFHENASLFAGWLEDRADAAAFNVTPLCGELANRTVMETVMASDNEEVSERDRQLFMAALQRGNDLTAERVWKPWLLNDWVYARTSAFREFQASRQVACDLAERIVRSKREAIAKKKKQQQHNGNDNHTNTKRRLTFLDHVLASEEGAGLSDAELVEETKVLYIAASGSSMDVLSFMYYTLALRQDLQDRLVEELREVFGGDAVRAVLDSDLPHLGLCERFVKETLRYFPVLPMFGREVALEDVTLPSGHTLPRGCVAAFFLPAVHRDPAQYPQPDCFDPDRFLPERSRGRHPYAFLTFSAGPRNCVAYRYAMMFLQAQLATVLRRVRVLPAPGAPASLQDVPITLNLTATITGGGYIRTQRRHWQ